MSRPVLTIRTTHPRIHCLDTDQTVIRSRTQSASAWAPLWNSGVVSYATSAAAKADAALAAEDDLDSKFFSLGLAGWVDGVTSFHSKLRSAGLYLCNNLSLWSTWPNRREQVLGLAYGYDFLAAGGAGVTFSVSDRKLWGNKLLEMCDYTNATGYIDGHDRGNHMAQLIAGLVLRGEFSAQPPGYDHTVASDFLINQAFDLWYGATAGAICAMDSERYFSADGGSGKGCWYNVIASQHSLMVLDGLSHACSSITLDGAPYAPFTDEAWVAKFGEWWARAFTRQNQDYWPIGDTGRTYVNPFFDYRARLILAILAREGGAWRPAVRWLRDRLHTQAGTAPYGLTKNHFAIEVASWNPADPASASKSLKTLGAPKGRLFDPHGDFLHHSDLDMQDGVNTHIQCREVDYPGHTHLHNGGMEIEAYGDMVLLFTGHYSTSDTQADFGGQHHRGWLQQSIAASGVPLVYDPANDTHKARNLSGSLVDWPTGLGGQMWKRFNLGGGNYSYDPGDTTTMRTQGSKLAWRRAGTDAAGKNKFRIVDKATGIFWFLHADYTHAYLQEAIDLGTTKQRATLVESKWLIIEDVSSAPVILRMDRVISRVATFVKRQHWHTFGKPNVVLLNSGTAQKTIQSTAAGFLGVGQIIIDTFAGEVDFGFSVQGGNAPNTLDALASGQFAYGGVEYAPTNTPNEREKPDFGRWRLEITPTIARTDDTFLTALFPLRVGQSKPSYQWIHEPMYLGLDFGGGKQVRLHRTDPVAIVSSAPNQPPPPPPPASGPPALVQNLIVVPGPASGQATAFWSPNTDAPTKYRIKYRVKP